MLAGNGKGLCEVRATPTESGEENRTLAKTIFVFSKLQKNKKRNGFLRVLSENFLRFPSTPHLAKPMLCEVLLCSCLVTYHHNAPTKKEPKRLLSHFQSDKSICVYR